MDRARAVVVLSTVTALAVAGFVIASSPESGPTPQERRATDGAVIDALLPVNDDGIAIARIAAQRATRARLRSTALGTAQELALENDLMRSIHKRLFGRPASLSGGGMPIHGGISFDPAAEPMDPAMLRAAKPFDREFIDMMIAVQRRASALARTQVASGDNGDLKQLAGDIARRSDARAARLDAWRRAWYGGASPAMAEAAGDGSMAGMRMP